ncbi:thiopurine S-methyltransferase [Hwanghaeella grinnelliae]|uniref:Thiopurine S-methyltransferase n=1 Tax=Hwanghaeella grinnelliae TaxID=2500179 RepID=A0A3S2Z7W1_9PROT|nr:thiopurine S-methyltransferase [Hwanghaeella grinnelliae]RVU35772.1 thiopurine S-methyltransferase [Hwanghaeella grinnelliae]
MDPDFWHRKWADNQIGFHEGETNALLEAHFGRLDLARGSRVFLPLCGKTRDIAWLLDQGFCVAGAELSATAIKQLFEDLGLAPEITTIGSLDRHSAPGIDIFVGDIFDLTAEKLGPVDAIYDRAALVALPKEMRTAYAAHLASLTATAPQFLITFTYDQSKMDGPPFSVSEDEVRRLYEIRYEVTNMLRKDLPGGLKGQFDATEDLWLLNPK